MSKEDRKFLFKILKLFLEYIRPYPLGPGLDFELLAKNIDEYIKLIEEKLDEENS